MGESRTVRRVQDSGATSCGLAKGPARPFNEHKYTLNMKSYLSSVLAPVLLALALPSVAQVVREETTKTTTTTTNGTLNEFGPERIIVRTETNASPLTYSVSKTTTYVDDAGAPVAMETVKSGLPITVHYTRNGDALVANKVIVHKRTTTTPGAT